MFHSSISRLRQLTFATGLLAMMATGSNAHSQSLSKLDIVIPHNFAKTDLSSCSSQHLLEHLLARKIDRQLRNEGTVAAVGGAVSSIDTIVIRLDFDTSRTAPDDLESAVRNALLLKTDEELFDSELPILTFEEQEVYGRSMSTLELQRSVMRQLGSNVIIGCSIDEYIASKAYYIDYTPKFAFAYTYQSGGISTIVGSTENGFDQNWFGVGLTPDRWSVELDPRSNALLVANPEMTGFLGHFRLASLLFRVFGQRDRNITIRPFGIGGFVVHSPVESLEDLERELDNASRKSLKPGENIMEEMRGFMRAYEVICRAPRKAHKEGTGPTLFAARLYFLASADGSLCREPSGLIASRNGFEANPTPPFIRKIQLPRLDPDVRVAAHERFIICLASKAGFPAVSQPQLWSFAQATRKYLRIERGLVLDLEFELGDNGCITFLAFMPESKVPGLIEELREISDVTARMSLRLQLETARSNCEWDASVCRVRTSQSLGSKRHWWHAMQFVSEFVH